MAYYYVNMNAQDNGDHEVHVLGCQYIPAAQNLLYLGNFDRCQPAVKEATKTYLTANGCYYCSRDCHTT